MEILNNIWVALSTENAVLIKILLIPLTFLENYLCLKLFTNILQIDCNKKQKKQYIFFVTIIGVISMNIILPPINTIINYLLIFFVIKKIFKSSLTKTVISIIVPFAIFSVTGMLILNTIIKMLHIEFDLVNTVPIYRLLYLFFLYIFIFILLYFIKYKRTKVSILDNLSKTNKKIVALNFSFGFFTLIIQLFIMRFYIDILPLYITFLSSLSLGFYFIISFYSLKHTMKLQKTSTDLENAENYNKTLSFLYDNVKGFKHDFDDIVNMIGGYIKTNDINGLKTYYIDLEKDYEKIKNLATLNPNLINNPGIYNLLVSKYKKAMLLDVKIYLEYFFDFEKLHMPIYQFSRMLGILLDNAIEAASTTSKKEVRIYFRDSQNNRTQIITIENTYSNTDVDTYKIFEKGFTGKEEHMGMGLWEVKQILMKNNNTNLITTKDKKYFKQQLEIYY